MSKRDKWVQCFAHPIYQYLDRVCFIIGGINLVLLLAASFWFAFFNSGILLLIAPYSGILLSLIVLELLCVIGIAIAEKHSYYMKKRK